MTWFKIILPVAFVLGYFCILPKFTKESKSNKSNPIQMAIEEIEQAELFKSLHVVSLLEELEDFTWPKGVPRVPFDEESENYMRNLVPSAIDSPAVQPVIKAVKVSPVKEVPLTENYKVNVDSMITASVINSKLGGVLKNKGDVIIQNARKYNICPIFLTAVAMHESANGTSKYANDPDLNNIAGIMREIEVEVKDKKTGKRKKIKKSVPRAFTSVNASIEFTAKLLGGKQYAGGKRDTIAEIQREYCPIGANNDPKKLNKFWLGGVMSYMETIWGKKIMVKS